MAFTISDILCLVLILEMADHTIFVRSFAMGFGFICKPAVHPFIAPERVRELRPGVTWRVRPVTALQGVMILGQGYGTVT